MKFYLTHPRVAIDNNTISLALQKICHAVNVSGHMSDLKVMIDSTTVEAIASPTDRSRMTVIVLHLLFSHHCLIGEIPIFKRNA